MLTDVFQRSYLKEKFEAFTLSETDINKFSENIMLLDFAACLDITKASMKNYEGIQKFLDHCCQVRHYFFCVKKCGQHDCSVCKPNRLPREVFDRISFLSDPMPQNDGHYKEFMDILWN